MINVDDLVVPASGSLLDALKALDRTGSGFLMAVDESGRMAGVVTDGDVRRALLRGVGNETLLGEVMQRDCLSLPVDTPTPEIRSRIKGRISFIPLVNEEGRPVDYASASRQHRHPVAEPQLAGNESLYVEECVRTGWISSQGRFVKQFEEMVAAFHGVPHALAVSNGTVALHLSLVSLGIGPGDEVIVPDFTFAATANAVIHAGATPVLVDVDPETWVMTPKAVELAITPRTRAIIPVHLYGHPCRMTEICELAKLHKLAVVEDCAESFGARYDGQITGSFGDAGCFSFFGNKTITTGEGGMVLFQNRKLYEHAQCLRDHGMSPQRRYWHEETGYNYRLTNLQAAVGVAQMERIDDIQARKKNLAAEYCRHLEGLEGIAYPPRGERAEPVCWLYTVMIEELLGLTREEVSHRLLSNGIETRPVFHPLHVMPAFQMFAAGGDYPVTVSLSKRGLSLPSATTLNAGDIARIASTIRSITHVRRMTVEAANS
jgi:perosamine synthetase